MELARAGNEPRIGGEDAVDVRVDLACVSPEGRGERDRGRVRSASAERRDVEVRRDALEAGDEDDAVGVERLVNPVRSTSTIFAFPCTVSVTIPACDPVSEIASSPRSAIAIATRAQEMRSPTEMSMSISRGFGCGETSWARETSSSVCWPIAETTATTRFPARLASTRREATRRIFSGSATEVPPNFMTRVPAAAGGSAGSTAGTGSKVVSLMALQCPT